jgi:hypothetical protein
MASKTIFLLTICLLPFNLRSQVHSVGIQGGLTNSEYHTHQRNAYYKSSLFPNLVFKDNYSREWGKTFGLSYAYLSPSRIYAKVSIEYLERKYSSRIDYWSFYFESFRIEVEPFIFPGVNDTGYKSNYEFQYWSLPLSVGYSFPYKKWDFIPQIGLRVSKIKDAESSSGPAPSLMNVQEIGCDIESSNQVYYFEGVCYEYITGVTFFNGNSTQGYKRMVFDLLFGIEVKFHFSEKLDFNFSALRNQSVSNLHEYSDPDNLDQLNYYSFLAGISYQINKAKSD